MLTRKGRNDVFTLTKQEALAIQLKQLTHYTEIYGAKMVPVICRVLAANRSEELDDEPHPTWEVHRCIPCGGDIESIMVELGVKRAERNYY